MATHVDIPYMQATDEDAVMAILLYEESMAGRFGQCLFCMHKSHVYMYLKQLFTYFVSTIIGYSVLNLLPTPHFRNDDIGAYIGREVWQPHSYVPRPPLLKDVGEEDKRDGVTYITKNLCSYSCSFCNHWGMQNIPGDVKYPRG